MPNNNIVRILSILEIILLIIVGILSNKIADLFEINPVILGIVTLLITFVLALITYHKNPAPTKSTASIFRIRLTKANIDSVLMGLAYLPSAIFVSIGAFKLAKVLERGWLWIASGSVVSITLLLAPWFADYFKNNKAKLWPFALGFGLSLIYGVTGLLLLYSPKSFDNNIIIFALIGAIVLVGLKFVYMYYLMETTLKKWYQNLPDQ